MSDINIRNRLVSKLRTHGLIFHRYYIIDVQRCCIFDVVLDVVTVVSSSVGIWATINTTYRCMSPASFEVGGATVTFSDMRLEAYMPGNDLSPRGTTLNVFLCLSWWVSSLLDLLITYFSILSLVTESVCMADQASTTPPSTSASTTTTIAPAPTPPGTPERGSYSVNSTNGTTCLLAQMGLQLNVSYFSRSQNKVKESLRSEDNS